LKTVEEVAWTWTVEEVAWTWTVAEESWTRNSVLNKLQATCLEFSRGLPQVFLKRKKGIFSHL
jgi:hypothetical protein